jgi:hypothetical protein
LTFKGSRGNPVEQEEDSFRFLPVNAFDEESDCGHGGVEIHLNIGSLQANARLINRSVRAHWGVEISLHWVLDVGFNEDNSRKRTGFAAQNCSLLNRITLNLLKNEKTTKTEVRGKRLKAGWDNNCLIKLFKN